MAERHGMPAEDALEPDETILALAVCQPPGAIQRQARRPIRVVVTDRRFLALKTSATTGRSKGDVDFEIPLRGITSVATLSDTRSRPSVSPSSESVSHSRTDMRWFLSRRALGSRSYANWPRSSRRTCNPQPERSPVESSAMPERTTRLQKTRTSVLRAFRAGCDGAHHGGRLRAPSARDHDLNSHRNHGPCRA